MPMRISWAHQTVSRSSFASPSAGFRQFLDCLLIQLGWMSSTSQPLRDEGSHAQAIVAGAVAGLVSRFCIAPLDVVKIRLQLHYHSLADPLARPLPTRSAAGIIAITRDILRHEGIAGFWKGNIPAEGLYLSYGAVQFLAYRSTTNLIDDLGKSSGYDVPGAAKSFVSGAIAGTAATTATYPLDLLRTRFAAQGTERVYEGLLGSIRDITRHEGPSGFFRGLSAGVAQIIPYMGLFFSLYEGLKPLTSQINLPFGSGDALAGITASILSKSAVFPLDTVRKRLQVQGPTRQRYHNGHRIPVYDRGVSGTLKKILGREGVKGLYRGLSVGLVKAAPASAVTMWTYEQVMKGLRQLEHDHREDADVSCLRTLNSYCSPRSAPGWVGGACGRAHGDSSPREASSQHSTWVPSGVLGHFWAEGQRSSFMAAAGVCLSERVTILAASLYCQQTHVGQLAVTVPRSNAAGRSPSNHDNVNAQQSNDDATATRPWSQLHIPFPSTFSPLDPPHCILTHASLSYQHLLNCRLFPDPPRHRRHPFTAQPPPPLSPILPLQPHIEINLADSRLWPRQTPLYRSP
nr:mitochondrial thiamine pyrophosphate carrier 1 [Quercus suber]